MNRLLLTTAALIASIGSAQAQNLVSDGSFESVNQAPGTSDVYAAVGAWKTVSGSGIEVRNQDAGTAFDGNNFVELDSNSNSAMAQSLTTVAGASYTVSFEYSARPGTPASTNPIDVYWNGQLLGTPVQDGLGQSDNVWHLYSFSTIGTGSDVLAFAADGTSDGLGGALDAVSVTGPAPVAAVPEPSTMGLMAGGLALIGASLRRRRASR